VKQIIETIIMISEASHSNKSLWQVKWVIETRHCDMWSKLLKQIIMIC